MSPMEKLPDTEQQRAALFAQLFREHWQPLLRHAVNKLGTNDLAQDIVQETFLVLWNSDMLSRPGEVRAYLYGTIRHKILDEYRKDAVRLRYAHDQAGRVEQQFTSPDELLVARELGKIIEEEIALMPERMREIFELKKHHRLSIAEIAQKLDLSEQTVKNQLYRASNRLKDRLVAYDSSLAVLGIMLFGILAYLKDWRL